MLVDKIGEWMQILKFKSQAFQLFGFFLIVRIAALAVENWRVGVSCKLSTDDKLASNVGEDHLNSWEKQAQPRLPLVAVKRPYWQVPNWYPAKECQNDSWASKGINNNFQALDFEIF